VIETFELLLRSCEKIDLLFVNIQCATERSHEKVNFKFLCAVSKEPYQSFH